MDVAKFYNVNKHMFSSNSTIVVTEATLSGSGSEGGSGSYMNTSSTTGDLDVTGDPPEINLLDCPPNNDQTELIVPSSTDLVARQDVPFFVLAK